MLNVARKQESFSQAWMHMVSLLRALEMKVFISTEVTHVFKKSQLIN